MMEPVSCLSAGSHGWRGHCFCRQDWTQPLTLDCWYQLPRQLTQLSTCVQAYSQENRFSLPRPGPLYSCTLGTATHRINPIYI